MDMFIKRGKSLQDLLHFTQLLENYRASKTGALKNLASHMMVKLKDGFWRIL